ncbi:GRTP1 protein [Thecamonas trahens ATCC 50062]|uniref:GRTP1 protein n=1 Tax=Thecamonas trahens ATCC 50062 TaxID=461836 RepID=A0A0L0D2Q4_THETB|nr:GRTP1 protein [Thecamonas trahens ATCC 50062]KNC46486.1 GRTP1 protein [Thecamonas trahens ATCC 50062]|eukprot:XP_013760267.1 GRTP1 protein [Thecamonas trahens ATCC 50062]
MARVAPQPRYMRWAEVSGGAKLRTLNRGVYSALLVLADNAIITSRLGTALAQVDLDVPRSLPDEPLFRGLDAPAAREFLTRMLRAWVVLRFDVGYTQGINSIAAMLLWATWSEIGFPSSTKARAKIEDILFWTLVALLTFHLEGYFTQTMDRMKDDAALLAAIWASPGRALADPGALRHADVVLTCGKLHAAELDPLLVVPKWFLTLFTHVLPLELAAHVWDGIIEHGVLRLLESSLAIASLSLPELSQCEPSDAIAMASILHRPTPFTREAFDAAVVACALRPDALFEAEQALIGERARSHLD